MTTLMSFDNWILTSKDYNLTTTTSKFKLNYPLSNKGILGVIQEFIRSHEADKRPKIFWTTRYV